MFLAAFASLRTPESRAFYDRKRAEGKHHNAAVMCLAPRRCDVILAMLHNGTPYQPPRPIPELGAIKPLQRHGPWRPTGAIERWDTSSSQARFLRFAESAWLSRPRPEMVG